MALGVVGFSFQLFAACTKGFLVLSSALNLGKDASTLRCMLNLEEYRFHQWGEKSGLLSDYPHLERCELNQRLNRKLIDETLEELKNLLTDTEKLKNRYKLDLVPDRPSKLAEDGEGQADRGGGMLDQAVCHKRRGVILTKAKLVQSANDLPRRLWWAMADKNGFESLVRQIGFFVQKLVDFLDDHQQEIMRSNIRMLLLNVVALHDKLDELKAIQTSVEFVVGEDSPIASSAAVKHLRIELQHDRDPPVYTPTSTLQVNSPPPSYSSSLRNEYSTLDRPVSPDPKARSKSPKPSITSRTRRPPLPSVNPELIARKSGEGPRPNRETALYEKDQPIYIEWKSINRALRSKIRPRVENLAHLLHAPKHHSFRTLHCRGFFEDYVKCQYGFVFDRPAGCDVSKYPVSLLQMYRLKGFLPSQTERLRLAKILATALLQLHSAGWLHKSLRSENILFFPQKPQLEEQGSNPYGRGKGGPKPIISLSQPYIVGYEYARFDSTSEVSEQPSSNPEHDIYRHPLAIGDYSESFNRLFDIYALGLVLLEIANWRPLKKIVSKIVPELSSSMNGSSGRKSASNLSTAGSGDTPMVRMSQIVKIKEYLLDPTTEENIPRDLEFRMGEIYTKVVLACLRGDFLCRDGEGEEEGEEQDEGFDQDFDESNGNGTGVIEGARVSEGYLKKVVEELERCVV